MVGQARDGAAQIAAAVKPKLRGWLHAGMSPIALAAGIVLVALSPTTTARWTTAVFAASSVLLFTTSAVYHRGTWTPKVTGVLRRLDAVLTCRQDIELNVKPRIAVEALTAALRLPN